MIRLIQHRLLETAVLIFLLSLLIFGLFAAVPGDYLSEMELNPAIPASQVERMRAEFGLDQPFHLQYFKWLSQVGRGNLGYFCPAAAGHQPDR
jgi:peptide/nickel transport system permease protein